MASKKPLQQEGYKLTASFPLSRCIMMEVVETLAHLMLIIAVISGCVWMNHRIRLANFEHTYGYKYKKRKKNK